ncbi:hypothetical protein FRC01_008403 [Tulasnella sp. 417]|nr:hypothetical protein FRC01_008403 [Tulasnella sp. 417]
MPAAMVEVWATHWWDSLDPRSSLTQDSHLRFHGQVWYKSPPPPLLAPQEGPQQEGANLSNKGKAPAGKGKRTKSGRKVAEPSPDDANMDTDDEEVDDPKGKRRAQAPARHTTAASTSAHQGPTSTPHCRRPSGLAVYVDVPPKPTPRRGMDQAREALLSSPLTAAAATPSCQQSSAASGIVESQSHPLKSPSDGDSPVDERCTGPAAGPRIRESPPQPLQSRQDDYDSFKEIYTGAEPPLNNNAGAQYPDELAPEDGGDFPLKSSQMDVDAAADIGPQPPVTPQHQQAGSSTQAQVFNQALAVGQSILSLRKTPLARIHLPWTPLLQGMLETILLQRFQHQHLPNEIVTYSFTDGKHSESVEEHLKLWVDTNPSKSKTFQQFMLDVTASAQWAIKHSDLAMAGLAPLFDASVAVEWYSHVHSSHSTAMPRKDRVQLLLPWNNITLGSPLCHVFKLLFQPMKPLPILSTLLSHDGGWSLDNVAQFMHGLQAAVNVALHQAAEATPSVLTHSYVDLVLLARVITLLRYSRSLFHGPGAYTGPAIQDIDRLTDQMVVLANALAMVQYFVHMVAIPVIDLVLEQSLPNRLPAAIAPVAQTVMHHPAWWYKFRQGKHFGAKSLEIKTKNNLLANGLPLWCSQLTPEAWKSLSGQDRMVFAILLIIAVLQEAGPDGQKRADHLQDCEDMLVRVQVTAHRSQAFAEADSGPTYPKMAPVFSAWRGNPSWLSMNEDAAVELEEDITDTEAGMGLLSDEIDQGDLDEAFDTLTHGTSRLPSPRKPSTSAIGSRRLASALPASPSHAKLAAPALHQSNTSTLMSGGFTTTANVATHGLETIAKDSDSGSIAIETAGEGGEGVETSTSAKKRKCSKENDSDALKKSKLEQPASDPSAGAAAPQTE